MTATQIRFQAVTTDARLREDVVRLEALNTVRKLGRLVRKDYWKTTKTWIHKPKFFIKPSLRGLIASVDVGTTDPIYVAVDLGVDPKAITLREGNPPKRALTIAGVYTAKTIPGVISSRPGKSSGVIFRRSAKKWPGIKARDFTEAIADAFEKSKEADIILDQSMETMIKQSGF